MKIFMAAAAASTSGQSREEHKWDLLGLSDSCQHFTSWSNTARLTISQRSSERLLSFEFINLGNFLSKVSLTAHTGKKANWRPLKLSFPLHFWPLEGLALSVFTAALACHFLFAHPRWPHICTSHGVAPRLSYQEVLAQKSSWAVEASWEGTSQHPPSSSCFHLPYLFTFIQTRDFSLAEAIIPWEVCWVWPPHPT